MSLFYLSVIFVQPIVNVMFMPPAFIKIMEPTFIMVIHPAYIMAMQRTCPAPPCL